MSQDAAPASGHFCAHIPQDFNLDVQTNGNIRGVNPGDSKLLALNIRLHSELGAVIVRKMRCDDVNLKADK